MTDTFLTVVFRNPTKEEASELAYHAKLSAISWSHALDERDKLKWESQKHQMTDTLYNRIWETVGKRVGYGIDCDVLTDALMDIFNEEKKKGRPYYGPVRDNAEHQRRLRIQEQSIKVAKYMAEELNEN